MPTVKCAQHPDREINTELVSEELEPFYCRGDNCGQRLGWYHTGYHEPVAFCDCCAADWREEPDTE